MAVGVAGGRGQRSYAAQGRERGLGTYPPVVRSGAEDDRGSDRADAGCGLEARCEVFGRVQGVPVRGALLIDRATGAE